MTINHIGISGGKDSTALLLWAVHESGYPKESIHATFCDTDNEHQITLTCSAALADLPWRQAGS
jgi:7-cyano-7-deazaguanine synthase in queuosine biosynthesis